MTWDSQYFIGLDTGPTRPKLPAICSAPSNEKMNKRWLKQAKPGAPMCEMGGCRPATMAKAYMLVCDLCATRLPGRGESVESLLKFREEQRQRQEAIKDARRRAAQGDSPDGA